MDVCLPTNPPMPWGGKQTEPPGQWAVGKGEYINEVPVIAKPTPILTLQLGVSM